MISILALLLQAAPAPAAVASWAVAERPNTNPGVTSILASVSSADGSKLAVRCDASKMNIVSVQFFSSKPLGGPPTRPVSMTFDANMPMIDNWEFAKQGAFQRDDMAVTTLASGIAAAKVIKVHTTTIAGEGVDASFAGPGTAAPITQVLKACGYALGQPPVRAPVSAPAPDQPNKEDQ